MMSEETITVCSQKQMNHENKLVGKMTYQRQQGSHCTPAPLIVKRVHKVRNK
jgi:hypothetical protein